VLESSAFTSANPSARLAETEWQILSQSDRRIVLNVMREASTSNRLRVPKLILEPETAYLWKVRHFDQYGNASPWSTECAFTTRQASYFLGDNGVPANQDVPADADLNDNDVSDNQESATLKSILTPDGRMIAVGIAASQNVRSLDTAIVTDPVAEGVTRNADLLPYGLLSYRIRVREPGQQAAVALYFSEPVRTPSFWMAFGDQGRWSDCSSSVYPQSDGFSVERLITDGGPDDADGVANGVIVDILAPQAESMQLGDLDRGLGNSDSADSAARAGCFIRSVLLLKSLDK
jgi:chitinase